MGLNVGKAELCRAYKERGRIRFANMDTVGQAPHRSIALVGAQSRLSSIKTELFNLEL